MDLQVFVFQSEECARSEGHKVTQTGCLRTKHLRGKAGEGKSTHFFPTSDTVLDSGMCGAFPTFATEMEAVSTFFLGEQSIVCLDSVQPQINLTDSKLETFLWRLLRNSDFWCHTDDHAW